MADPAFTHKLVFEQLLAFSSSMLYEWRVRGENFKKEIDLALINSMGMAAAVGATVWITAPSRAYGAVHKFPWQQMLSELPHCVFDANGPLRNYTNTARVGGFFASMAQLSAVGALTGGATSLLSSLAVKVHKQVDPSYEPSVAVPDVARSSGGLGAFFALTNNVRYQLLGGMDRYLFGHSNFMWTYMGFSGFARLLGAGVSELSRSYWQGLPTQPALQMKQRTTQRVRKLKKKRQSAANSSSKPSTSVQLGASETASPAVAAADQQDYQPIAGTHTAATSTPAATMDQPAASAASLSDAAATAATAAPQGHQPTSADESMVVAESRAHDESLESSVEQQLLTEPAVMGSVSQLQQLANKAHAQQLSASSTGGVGQALREAVGQAVA